MTLPDPSPLYLVAVRIDQPMIMCERHAREFERLMTDLNTPHTIIELDDEPTTSRCQVCETAELQMQALSNRKQVN